MQHHKSQGSRYTFQRQKLLAASLLILIGLLVWLYQKAQPSVQPLSISAACLRCQQQLAGQQLDSLTLIGSLLIPDATSGTYYWTVRDPQTLKKLKRLSRLGQPLQLGGTNLRLNSHSSRLWWYPHKAPGYHIDVAQTKDGQPYTDCGGDYTFTSQPQLIQALDSLQRTQPNDHW